jgi:hypothetical protein
VNPLRRIAARTLVLSALGAASVGGPLCAQGADASPAGRASDRRSASTEAPDFVRSTSRDGVVALDTGTTIYRRADGTGPTIALVGVVHIGDKAYYARLVELLDRHETVLFESVMPRGSFGAGGADDDERRRTTIEVIDFLRDALEAHLSSEGELPGTIAELRAFMAARDSRAARSIDLAMIDGWGNPVTYRREDAQRPLLTSFGADGVAGGEGAAADIVATELGGAGSADPAHGEADRGGAKRGKSGPHLYETFAASLGTDTQIGSIDYDRAHWWPADMSAQRMKERLLARGVRSSVVDIVSAGDGLQLGLIRLLLGIASKSPEFKRTVIKMLGTASEQSRASGIGGEEMAVILDERNEVVVARLRELLASDAAPRSIAVFYGAAHMPGIGASLEREFGLVPVESTWFTAMSDDGWGVDKIEARIAALERSRAATVAADPMGAFPACAEVDARLDALRARLATRRLQQ